MHFPGVVIGVAGMLLSTGLQLAAQSIDSVVTTRDRAPITIADQIHDPAERSAFAAILKTTDPQKLLLLARSFLNSYPQSAFLAPVAEKAARSSFDVGELQEGLGYARFSLRLLPENPLLLVSVADVEARLQQDEAAIASARDALDYLNRFDRPAPIAERQWPSLKRKQQATAWFAMGRAFVHEALAEPAERRSGLLAQAIAALSTARDLDPHDMESTFLLGVACRAANDLPHAAAEFSTVYRHGGSLSDEAYQQLQKIYEAGQHNPGMTLESFITNLKEEPARSLAAPVPSAAARHLGRYAGSTACQECHQDIYQEWSKSGMARMLQPYQADRVKGDFQKDNEFYIGEEFDYQDGKLRITPGADRRLFARMVLRDGRPFFDIRHANGLWHSYRVDYTIGSKWQQAYATRLSNGQIHVFPIQYSMLEKKWINYWSVIDASGTERSDPGEWEKLDASSNYMISCAVCHTSQLHNVRGGGFDPDHLAFREPGVGCEMCHGPSADHVRAMGAGDDANRNPLEPPVDFNRVSNRDFVAICGQCHMQSNLHAGGARGELNYSTAGTFYLKSPALPLSEFTVGAFYKDGRFRQTTFMVEALERSRCFRRGQVNCGTCHDPHGHSDAPNLTSLRFPDQPDRMCTGCHTQFSEKQAASAHTHHPFSSEGSRCVSCHMPRIMDALLFRARSHQIDDIPDAAMTLRFGQKDSPNACLLCHATKTASWVQEQLQRWNAPPREEASR